MDAIRTLQDTQAAMACSTSRRAEMELALLKLSDRRVSPSREALVARIEELEAKLNRLLAEDPPRIGPGAATNCRRNVPATTRGTGRTGAGSAARHGAAPAAGGSSPTGCKACRYPSGANAGGSVAAGAGSPWRHQ